MCPDEVTQLRIPVVNTRRSPVEMVKASRRGGLLNTEKTPWSPSGMISK